jgi:hypothetical protein
MISRVRPSPLLLSLLVGLLSPLAASCGDDEGGQTGATPVPGAGGSGGGGTAGAGGGTSGSSGQSGGGGGSSGKGGNAGTTPGEPPVPQPGPGEVCEDLGASKVNFYFSPNAIYVAAGKTREVTLTLEPDFCTRRAIDLAVDGAVATLADVGGAVPSPGESATKVAKVDLTHPKVVLTVKGVAEGDSKVTAAIDIDGTVRNAELPVHVMPSVVKTCTGSISGKVNPGGKLGGSADVAGAELGLQAGSDTPVQATEGSTTYDTPVLWTVSAFDATVGCTADIVPAGLVALGPAVTFGPATQKFPRELPMAIPINPALFPDKARLRHLKVSYSGPAFKTPRTIPVGDPRIETMPSGETVLRFVAPRLGTYQAVISPDAGSKVIKRRLTHKAVMGVSMGGGGASIFGLRHHDKFDVVGPLGGPVDWTWMLHHIENNHIGGFAPNDGDTAPAEGEGLLPMPVPQYPYEHPSTFNRWWYEFPREGNGGSFPRNDYTQIFRDLALMHGNPNSQNDIPGAENLPRGVTPDMKSVTGDHTNGECQVFLDPIGGSPDEAKQKEIANSCPAERCKYVDTFQNYYDDEFNPKGKFPVITVCDGSPQDKTKSPYANNWTPNGNDVPLEVGLAVDYNGNGVRDLNEPILRQGHEPWRDSGEDGKLSADEDGYQAGVNEDPAGDDYDAQYNPNGTEGDGRWQEGEPFDDFGLDGVPNTKDSPYDIGEGDGKFTVANGLARFWEQDSRSVMHQWSTPPGGAMTDEAVHRVDLWTDGGTRDLFNFGVDAQHLLGSFVARGRDAAYYTDFSHLPGQKWDDKLNFLPQGMTWEDLPGAMMVRYGPVDPTVQDLLSGSGQHVGTGNEVTARLRSAIYFSGKHWPDAPRTFVEESNQDTAEGAPQCEIIGTCDFQFTDTRGRKGPVTVNVPPGYAHKTQTEVRYPVIYVLHGYGQTPEDLGAAIVFLRNWMNSGLDSSGTRLGRFILVYADGRCRPGPTGEAECIRGTFYADSPREKGGKLESWFLELMNEIDGKFRTMGETTVDWTE